MDLRATFTPWPRRTTGLVVAVCLLLLGFGQVRHLDAGAAAGRFSVQGTQVIDPSGRPFVPVGVNLLGPNTWWERPTLGLSGAVQDWKFNTVRLNVNLPPGQFGFTLNNDLDAIVGEYTAKGIVVMIEMHSLGNGSYPDGADLDTLRSWWVDIANRYKANTYVWFNIMNEPGSEAPVSDRWRSVHDDVSRAIRATGADNIIVLDGGAWGQDAFSWDGGPVPTGNSAILTYGPRLAAAHANLLFSFHVYDQWNTTSAKMADYLDRVHAAGLAVVIGEVGAIGYVNGAVRDFSAAARAAVEVAPPRGVGLLAWHGQSRGGGEGFNLVNEGPIDQINSTSNPTNLTPLGADMWAVAHALAATAVPAQSLPAVTTTTTVAPTTTTTVAPTTTTLAPTTTTVAPTTTTVAPTTSTTVAPSTTTSTTVVQSTTTTTSGTSKGRYKSNGRWRR